MRTLSRLALVMETLRLALTALEAADPAGLRAHRRTSWADRYGPWTQHERRVPGQGEAARAETQRRLQQTGDVGQWLLDRLDGLTPPAALRQLPAVDVLRRVWRQQFEVVAQRVSVRATVDVSGAELLQAPHDPDVRYGEHGGQGWQDTRCI